MKNQTPSRIQSVIISRSEYSKQAANKWIVDHGYKLKHRNKPVDITTNYYRYRQLDPKPEHKYRLISLSEGIKGVLEI